MKKLMMIIGLAVITLNTQAQEQERKSAQERAKAHTERMVKELGLSAEQAAKVEAINAKYAAEVEARRATQQTQRDAQRQEGKARREAHDADLKAVLTAEQYQKLVAKREAEIERRKEKKEELRAPAK